MADIGPGDLVVCVDTRAHPEKNAPEATRLKGGAVYRVVAVRPNRRGFTAFVLRKTPGVWMPWRFRKLEGPPPVFAEMLESVKQPEKIDG